MRRQLLDSVAVSEAITAIKSQVDKIYYKVAQAPARLGTGKVVEKMSGFPLRSFLAMCEEAQLIGVQAAGRQLSRLQVKTVFLSALEITASSSYRRRPLLTRSEFDEALLRLAYHYEATDDTGPTSRAARRNSSGGTPLAARPLQGHAVLPQDGDKRAAVFAKEVGTEIAAKVAQADAQQQHSPLEEAILAKLPLIVGRLLAMFEQIHKGASLGAVNEPFVVDERFA